MPIDRAKHLEQFKNEVREHIQNINNGLLKLEKNPKNKELIDSLMRETHTIKGISMMMGYKRIADIAHAVEDGLQSALNAQIELFKSHFDIMLKSLDAMEPLLEDKLTWEDKGVESPFVVKLCTAIKDVFGGKPVPSESVAAPVMVPPFSPDVAQAVSTPIQLLENAVAVEDTMRVDVQKIDTLVDLSGEMLVARERLNELVKTLILKLGENQDDLVLKNMSELKEASYGMTMLTTLMQNEMMKVRMIPVSYLFNSFSRVMRDLAYEKGKDVQLSFIGEDTRLDKNIVNEIKDPIMHILRNAIDHGIEPPQERVKKGKPATGTIVLEAFQKGAQVVIEISDDGAGVDVNKVRLKAVELDLLTEENAFSLPERQLFNVLFSPHFSTSDIVTATSGRGIGLNVVSDKIKHLKGIVEVESLPGRGAKFILKLPLTLAITENLLVSAEKETFAIPIHAVVETLRISSGDIRKVETKEAISIRGHILPLIRLNNIFQLAHKGITENKFFSVIVVQSAEKRLGILVNKVIGRSEIVLKPLGDPLTNIPNIAGATILGNGKIVLIIDVPSLIDYAQGIEQVFHYPVRLDRPKIARKKYILLAEDTPSTAMLETSVLESVGYSVMVAKDGWEAFEKIKQENFDLVITDIMMPRINGFALTEKIKRDPAYNNMPVIIVTTRENEEDRRRGLEAGADAYILKSEFTAEILLDTIESLIG